MSWPVAGSTPFRSRVLFPAPVGHLTRAAGSSLLIRLAILGIFALAAAGCGSAAKRVIPAPVAMKAAYGPHPYASATAERNKLLALAKPGTDVPQGNVPNWPPANGSAIPATATEVSGFGFNVDKTQNVQYLSFAVADRNHGCAGGDIVTNAKGTKVISASPIKLPRHAPCTGDEVAELAGHG
jgi:hypothetical protein